LLLASLCVTPVSAQEPVIEAAPAEEAAVPPADVESRAEEIDDLEPGVPSQVLTSDARPLPRSNAVMDELDLGRTEITGNQELPKVLYIVPWKQSDPGDLMGRPGNTLLDEILAPVDRGEFVRQVDYYDDLFESQEKQ
jgi:hypothetical protein